MTKATCLPRWTILLALVLIWMAISACSCGDRLAQVRREVEKLATVQSSDTATEDQAQEAAKTTSAPTSTPAPIATATLAVPTAAVSAQGQAGQLNAPQLADKHVDMTLTEDEINDLVAGQSISQQGVEVEDVTVRITADEIIADLRATYAEAGISAGVQVRGVPVVHNGDLYVRITDVELDDSVSGFMRLVADQLVKQAIEQYSTEYGIYVPQEELVFESVELMPQQIHVVGERR